MKNILKLLSYFFPLAIALCANATAKQLRCEYDMENLQVDAALRPGFERSYTVDVSCTILCAHHNDRDSHQIYRTTISPVVVEEVGEKGKADAIKQGRVDAARKAWSRLLEDCGVFKCDCKDKGCACDACGQPAPRAASLQYRMETAPIPKHDASINSPIALKEINNPDDIKKVIKEYIEKHFKNSNIAGYIKTMIDGRFIEMVSITDEKHQAQLVYFDMTDLYKKLEKSRDKETRHKVEQLIKKHMPLPKEDQPAE